MFLSNSRTIVRGFHPFMDRKSSYCFEFDCWGSRGHALICFTARWQPSSAKVNPCEQKSRVWRGSQGSHTWDV